MMAFELAALSAAAAGDTSIHGNGDVVKQTIVTAILMVSTRGIETMVAIVHGRRAGCRHGFLILFLLRTVAT